MLIIFDCDGVLRSVSWQALHEAYKAIAVYLHMNPKDLWEDVCFFRKWLDPDWRVNLERMGIPREREVSEINNIFHTIYDPHIRIFPWVKNIIEELSFKYDLAVLSTSLSSSVSRSLDGLAGYFSMVIGCDHVRRIKPDPEGILLILKKLQVEASQSFMIGDTSVDILSGRGAGVKTVGVTWGMETEEDLRKLEPDFVFTDPQQLLNIKMQVRGGANESKCKQA